jgi:hypothetical protein
MVAPKPRFQDRGAAPTHRGTTTDTTVARGVGERAQALVREQPQHGPPEASVMATAEAAEIPERSLIATASVVRRAHPAWAVVAAGVTPKTHSHHPEALLDTGEDIAASSN